ncbi:hypothetical protein JCM19000A_25630 [Silvimonas sp. JCM 19000]
MSLSEAARTDIALWPGNQESLSQAMYGSAHTLRHKLSGYRGMVFGLNEALELMQLTQGRETIRALAREVGGVYLDVPGAEMQVGNEELHVALLRVTERMAKLSVEVHKALIDDAQIDSDEKRRIDAAMHELTEEILRYVALVYRVYGNRDVQDDMFKGQR